MFLLAQACENELFSQEEEGQAAKLLEDIFKLHMPEQRGYLLSQLVSIYIDPSDSKKQNWTTILAEYGTHHVILPALLIFNIDPTSPNVNPIVSLLAKERDILKHAAKLRQLMSLLVLLQSNISISCAQKLNILKVILEHKNKKERIKLVQMCHDLINMKQLHGFYSLKDSEEIKKDFYKLFQNLLLTNVANFEGKFEATLEQFRQKEALVTYAARLQQLDGKEKEDALYHLNYFLESVLNSKFLAKRYRTDFNPHLEKIFKFSPYLQEKWPERTTLSSQDFVSVFEKNEMVNFCQQFTSQVIKRFFITPACAQQFPQFAQMLQLSAVERATLEVDLRRSFVQLRQKLRQVKEEEEKAELELSLANMEIRLLLLSLSHSLKATQALEKVKRLHTLIPQIPEQPIYHQLMMAFKTKLKDLIENKFKKESKWTATITDDPNDLLLIGTEIPDSCQNVNFLPAYNKCLLGYILDGKNLAAVVKDESKRIGARCILRLLWDNEKNKPALFKERDYINPGYQNAIPLLNELCKNKAKSLGLDLYFKPDRTSTNGTTKLASLGGPSKFEYKDAIGPKHYSSTYVIQHCIQIPVS